MVMMFMSRFDEGRESGDVLVGCDVCYGESRSYIYWLHTNDYIINQRSS